MTDASSARGDAAFHLVVALCTALNEQDAIALARIQGILMEKLAEAGEDERPAVRDAYDALLRIT